MKSTPFPIRALFAALFVLGFAQAASAGTTDEVKSMIIEESAETDVPTSLALAIAKTGSDFRPDFKGPNGARGVMQVLPETAEGMGVTPAASWQPRRNIQIGLKVLSHLLERTEGDWAEAVSAYNAQLFKPGSDDASRRIADTLQWERRFAEQAALQDPIPDPIQDPVQKRRREVMADSNPARDGLGRDTGHDAWRDDQVPSNDQPAVAQSNAPAAVDTWMESAPESRVEVVIVEPRPVIVQAPPPPTVIWRSAPPPRVVVRTAPPPRVVIRPAPPPRVVWVAPNRQPRFNRDDRRYRRWLRQMSGGIRGGW